MHVYSIEFLSIDSPQKIHTTPLKVKCFVHVVPFISCFDNLFETEGASLLATTVHSISYLKTAL